MNEVIVINANDIQKKRKLSRNTYTLIVMIILFLLGEIVGTILFSSMSSEEISSLSNISQSFFRDRINLAFYENVINSFSSGFMLLFVSFLLGFGIIFQPLALAVPFYKGIGLGVIFSEVMNCFEIHDAVISMVIILPYSVLSSLVIIIASREAFNMSCGFFKHIFAKKSVELNVRLYINKFLLLTFLLAIFSVIDSLIIFIGSKFL